MAAPLDYRLLVYARLWDLLLASDTLAAAVKPANRVKFDSAMGKMQYIRTKHSPNDFPKIALFYGNGSDSGFSPRYGGTYDLGQAVDVQQAYRLRLSFERPDLVFASPLIAEARAAILRGGPRLGGASVGFGYVKLSGISNSTNTIGPDPETAGSGTVERLVSEFDVNIAMVLTIGQLTG